MKTKTTTYLLDTQAFIHAIGDHGLPPRVTARLQIATHLYLSLTSIWEMTIKISINKLDFGLPLSSIIEMAQRELGVQLLTLSPQHIYRLATLKMVHRDPFDRLIAAQALEQDMTLVSSDRVFDEYGVRRLWAR